MSEKNVGKLSDYFKSLDDFMTVTEAARLWGLSSRWVRTMCSKGKIESYKLGTRWLVVRDQVSPCEK